MLAHHDSSRLGVPTLQRPENRLAFVHRILRQVGRLIGKVSHQLNMEIQALQAVKQSFVVCEFSDRCMKFAVRLLKLGHVVGLQCSTAAGNDVGQPAQPNARKVRRGKTNRQDLEFFSHLIQVVHLLTVESPHEIALIGPVLYNSIAGQLPDGFAERGPADAHTLG